MQMNIRERALWIVGVLGGVVCASLPGCSDEDRAAVAPDMFLQDQGIEVRVDHTSIPDRGLVPDAAPSPRCPDWHCTGENCGELIQMPGPTEINEAAEAGYFIWGGLASFYRRWIRRDVALIVSYAACEVHRQFPDADPLGLGDMSEENGAIPGTSKGHPAHPEGTHTDGYDMDVAYYQTDGTNELQSVCGDGSDTNPNNKPGKYNDGSFCTTTENIVNWPQQVYFFAKLFEAERLRVLGIDQQLVSDLGAELKKQREAGLISDKIFADFNDRIAWGAAGGWEYHFHHVHLSFQ
jgi:hypothetical protein